MYRRQRASNKEIQIFLQNELYGLLQDNYLDGRRM